MRAKKRLKGMRDVQASRVVERLNAGLLPKMSNKSLNVPAHEVVRKLKRSSTSCKDPTHLWNRYKNRWFCNTCKLNYMKRYTKSKVI